MQEQVYISASDGLFGNRRRNLHITVGFLSFITMLFHFTVVFFFTLELQSIALVGIFLGIGNLFSFFFDIPVGILQYHFRSKTLYLMGVLSQLIAMTIFAFFIFQVTDIITDNIAANTGPLQGVFRFLLGSVWNLILMLIAAMCYGFTKEVNDITTISYVMSNATPDQYKSVIANNNLSVGIGSFMGLLLSWFILSFNPKFVIFFVVFIIIAIFLVTLYFFDNSKTTLEISQIKNFRINFSKSTLDKAKDTITSVDVAQLKNIISKENFIFLKPVKKSENPVSFQELKDKTIETMKDVFDTLKYSLNAKLIVFWSCSMVLIFGFWDTFASTFLLKFLDDLKPGWSYILLAIIAIPAYGLQDFFGKIADKRGVFKISMLGVILSGVSLVGMGIVGAEVGFIPVMILAFINSIGYSICMSIAVATFLESYNAAYAQKKNLKDIDANASAAPMKILQNLANVIGLFLGGFILSVFGYNWFFLLFGVIILGFFFWSTKNKKQIQ